MLASVCSAALLGIDAVPVQVEVNTGESDVPHLIMIGPPGSGKSMIAKRIPGIMPQPTLDEYLDILRIHSAAGQTMQTGLHFLQRPSRTPHHAISDVGLLGGGAIPGPGEISLAHHGVLFPDELPEFKRSALEVLRQPLETGSGMIRQIKCGPRSRQLSCPTAFSVPKFEREWLLKRARHLNMGSRQPPHPAAATSHAPKYFDRQAGHDLRPTRR